MSLAAHLHAQQARLDDLVALLERERALLAAGHIDGEALAPVAEQKRAALAALEESEQRRRQAQRRLGYPDDRQGDQRAAADAGCTEPWLELIDRAHRAARLNRDNGAIIELRMAHNQRLLNTLRERSGRDLYGPDGQQHGGGGRLNQHA